MEIRFASIELLRVPRCVSEGCAVGKLHSFVPCFVPHE